MPDSECRIYLGHFAERTLTFSFFKTHRHSPDIEFHYDLAGSAVSAQGEGCSQSGVTREGKFFLDGKDSDAHTALAFDLPFATENKSCFRKIHLLRNGLHFRIR